MPNRDEFDPSVYVHSPTDLAAMYVGNYEWLLENPGIPWDVASMDAGVVLPARPGDLIVVCGRPGSGKSSFMARQAKIAAQRILERGEQYEKCVMYVSWEQRAGELEVYFSADDEHTISDYAWTRIPIEKVKEHAQSRGQFPLWVIGYSRKQILKQSRVLTLDLVFDVIQNMVYTFKDSPRPVLLCFDYAQLIPASKRQSSYRLELKQITQRMKQLALQIGCPILVGAQARREVDYYEIPIPTMVDAQESSVLEQHPDKFFGLSRPWKWRNAQHYGTITVGGRQYTVTPDLFFLNMCKQRMEDGDKLFALRFSMAELKLMPLELNQQEPPGQEWQDDL